MCFCLVIATGCWFCSPGWVIAYMKRSQLTQTGQRSKTFPDRHRVDSCDAHTNNSSVNRSTAIFATHCSYLTICYQSIFVLIQYWPYSSQTHRHTLWAWLDQSWEEAPLWASTGSYQPRVQISSFLSCHCYAFMQTYLWIEGTCSANFGQTYSFQKRTFNYRLTDWQGRW